MFISRVTIRQVQLDPQDSCSVLIWSEAPEAPQAQAGLTEVGQWLQEGRIPHRPQAGALPAWSATCTATATGFSLVELSPQNVLLPFPLIFFPFLVRLWCIWRPSAVWFWIEFALSGLFLSVCATWGLNGFLKYHCGRLWGQQYWFWSSTSCLLKHIPCLLFSLHSKNS